MSGDHRATGTRILDRPGRLVWLLRSGYRPVIGRWMRYCRHCDRCHWPWMAWRHRWCRCGWHTVCTPCADHAALAAALRTVMDRREG
jgi:hypothetical protein